MLHLIKYMRHPVIKVLNRVSPNADENPNWSSDESARVEDELIVGLRCTGLQTLRSSFSIPVVEDLVRIALVCLLVVEVKLSVTSEQLLLGQAVEPVLYYP